MRQQWPTFNKSFASGDARMLASHLFTRWKAHSANISFPVQAFGLLWATSFVLDDAHTPRDALSLVVITEAIKLLIAVAGHWRLSGNTRDQNSYQELALDESDGRHGLHSIDHDLIAARPTIQDRKVSMIYALIVASLYVGRNLVHLKLKRHSGPLSLGFVLPATTLALMAVLRLCFARRFSILQYNGALLQFCGLYIVQCSISVYHISDLFNARELELAALSCAALVLTEKMYLAHKPGDFHLLNIMVFFVGFVVNLFVWGTRYFAEPQIWAGLNLSVIVITLLRASRDITSLYVISELGPAMENVAATTSYATVLLGTALWMLLPIPGVWVGCAIALLASVFYFANDDRSENHAEKDKPGYFWRVAVSLMFLALVALINIYKPYPPLRPRSLSSTRGVFMAAMTHPICNRKPTVELLDPSRTYHAFDNVLLIVFFSHARYDANIDYYKEVYSEYFPNMVFIGVANREDGGFSHSYDVLVDSYKSDENLTDPSFYKIAGRMAHHQLYTVMREHDCGYDGYLWAPFDTLLNIPRLEVFDQDRFWYHSPWGEFVPNPALEQPGRHAPPAIISPDLNTSGNLSETWRGWGEDWWWGEPHVGVNVCMPAFNKVPLAMRERLAMFTNGELRFVGGSQDTLYIPNRLRQDFMDVLGLFLETDCFSEIAIPTTVHLVMPPDETTLFVDHWWIWQPPFDVMFVRQKWEEGFEVDTFHRFYWGDKGEDGVWRGNHENVDALRVLFRDSARRQGRTLS